MRTIPTFFAFAFILGCPPKEDDDSGLDMVELDGDDGETGSDGGDGGTSDAGTTEGGTDAGTTGGGAESGGEEGGGTEGGEEGGGTEGGEEDGGEEGGGTGGGDGIAIAGSYWNEYGTVSYTIADTAFSEVNGPPSATTYTWLLSTYCNEQQMAIGENPAGHVSGEGWTRFDWGTEAGTLYICMTITDAADEAAALATDAADSSAGFESGCPALGGWMALTPF